MRTLACVLVAALLGCGGDASDGDQCSFPDAYVVRFVELDGDCGPRSPVVITPEDKEPPGCTRHVKELDCARMGSYKCANDSEVVERDWFLESDGGHVWTGEETLRLTSIDGSQCESRYSVTLTGS